MTDPYVETRRDRTLARVVAAGDERSLESLSIAVAAVAFVVTAVVALPVFGLSAAPIAGPGSAGEYAAISAAVVSFVAFLVGRYVRRQPGRDAPYGVLDYLDAAALAFAHAVIALLAFTLLAVILEQGFIGAEVFPLALLVVTGSTAALTAYLTFASATHLDLQLLAIVMAVFLALGILAATLTSSDPNWWKDNLSALGMSTSTSAMTFNITIIVGGFIVTTLARYATRGIPTSNPVGALRVRTCLIIIGIFLACVGVFKVDLYFALHTGVASGMVVAFGVLVLRLPKWLPGMPRTFFSLGLLFLAVTVVLAVLFILGYYTLTAVELVAGILVFTWIILFIRNAAALETDARQS